MVLHRQGTCLLRRRELAVYRPSLTDGKPEMTVRDAKGIVTPVAVTTAPAHNYMLGIDFQGNDIWVATAQGLSHGIRQP